MVESLQLPFVFNPERLRADLERIKEEQWIPHFNKRDYSGEWSGIALRGPADAIHPVQSLFANPNTTEWAFTEQMAVCPYFREIVAQFQCPLQSVRLLRLAPGAVIKEHRDFDLGYEDGEARLHIPIITGPAVEFMLNGARVNMRQGETWYVNVNLPHSVVNNSECHRVHLIIDCHVDEWLKGVFQQALGEPNTQSKL